MSSIFASGTNLCFVTFLILVFELWWIRLPMMIFLYRVCNPRFSFAQNIFDFISADRLCLDDCDLSWLIHMRIILIISWLTWFKNDGFEFMFNPGSLNFSDLTRCLEFEMFGYHLLWLGYTAMWIALLPRLWLWIVNSTSFTWWLLHFWIYDII
jgi:hypothetical protein